MTHYPKRQQFFAHRFVRLLTKSAAAQTLGPEVTWLLTVIVHQEDSRRYVGPVTYWNEQLMPLCGFRSKGRLARARQAAVDAGWLHYEPGGRNSAGRYWCLIPASLDRIPDGPCDESDPVQNRTANGPTDHSCANKIERQTVQISNGKRSPFYPIPEVLIPTGEVGATNSGSEVSMSFPVKGGDAWELPSAKVNEWCDAYPGVDIPGELRKARQWLRDNADKRKSPRGMLRFLGSWLSRVKPSAEPVGSNAANIMEEHTAAVLAQKRAELAAKRGGQC